MARLDINEAAKFLGYTPHYIRMLIRTHKIVSVLEPICEGSGRVKHMIEEDELIRYRDAPKTRSRREDRKNRFVFFAFPEQYSQIVKILDGAGFQDVTATMTPANTIKAMKFVYDPDNYKSGRFLD